MANIKQQVKRNITNEKKRLLNASFKSSVKTSIKNLEALVAEGKKEEAVNAYKAGKTIECLCPFDENNDFKNVYNSKNKLEQYKKYIENIITAIQIICGANLLGLKMISHRHHMKKRFRPYALETRSFSRPTSTRCCSCASSREKVSIGKNIARKIVGEGCFFSVCLFLRTLDIH